MKVHLKKLQERLNVHKKLVQDEEAAARLIRGAGSEAGSCEKEYALMEALHKQTLNTDRDAVEDIVLKGPRRSKRVRTGRNIAEVAEKLLELELDDFVFAVTIDFSKAKSVPHFGRTPQPGATYFMSKLNVELCGLMSHHVRQMTVEGRFLYWYFQNEAGPKHGDHLLSILLKIFLEEGLPKWLRGRLKNFKVFLDGAPATNKSQGHVRTLMFHVSDLDQRIRKSI
jgi:hypothetical protein